MRVSKQSGFTMIELMIIAVIIAIVAGLFVHDFSGAIRKIKWHNFATDIQSSLRGARSYAISHQKQYGVYFDTTANKLVIFEDKVNKSGYSYEPGDSVVRVDSVEADFEWFWVSFPNQTICFLPNGRASETGYIDGTNYDDGNYQSLGISVLAATGRVSVDWVDN